jgi:hypothetical protein
MAFSYDLTTNRGKVRFMVPDTDSAAYELQDDEVDYFLTDAGNSVKGAAVKACMWLARKYATKVSFSADGLSIQNSQRAEAYAARAKELQAEALGYVSSVELTKEDGYSEAANDSEYEQPNRIIYIDTD